MTQNKTLIAIVVVGIISLCAMMCLCGSIGLAVLASQSSPTPKPRAAATLTPPTAVAVQGDVPTPASQAETLPTNTPPLVVDTPTVEVPAETPAYKVGDNVTVGEVRWLITEVKDEGQTLKSDNTLIEPKTTAGKFLRLSFEIENLGKEPKSFTGLDLIDNQGRKFQNYSEGLFFIDQSVQCVLKPLNPGVPVKCQAMYELPADATGLAANPGDLNLFGGEEALINLQ